MNLLIYFAIYQALTFIGGLCLELAPPKSMVSSGKSSTEADQIGGILLVGLFWPLVGGLFLGSVAGTFIKWVRT